MKSHLAATSPTSDAPAITPAHAPVNHNTLARQRERLAALAPVNAPELPEHGARVLAIAEWHDRRAAPAAGDGPTSPPDAVDHAFAAACLRTMASWHDAQILPVVVPPKPRTWELDPDATATPQADAMFCYRSSYGHRAWRHAVKTPGGWQPTGAAFDFDTVAKIADASEFSPADPAADAMLIAPPIVAGRVWSIAGDPTFFRQLARPFMASSGARCWRRLQRIDGCAEAAGPGFDDSGRVTVNAAEFTKHTATRLRPMPGRR